MDEIKGIKGIIDSHDFCRNCDYQHTNRPHWAGSFGCGLPICSLAQGKAHIQSDVDVAVLFAERLTSDAIFIRTIAIGTVLEAQLSLPVDVVALNRASTFLRFQIIKTGRLVLETDRTARALFQMRAMNDDYDVKPYLDYQQTAMIRRIREKGLGHGTRGDRNALAQVRRLRKTFTPTPSSAAG